MKKMHIVYLLCSMLLISCGGHRTTKPDTTPPAASVPAPSSTPSASADTAAAKSDSASKPGGYYLDDGPGENPPANLESIPDAVPKEEPLQPRLNRPYVALGQTYQPMTKAHSYKKRGVASWYGKRFHGRKTSSGEPYDMYAMTAAHTVLPLPSYAKVTNVANGRSVIVRINDRGPFKKDRIIDLSYAAAYKLGLIARGSGLVEVEAVDQHSLTKRTAEAVGVEKAPEAKPVTVAINTDATAIDTPGAATAAANAEQTNLAPVQATETIEPAASQSYYVQAGAFKNEDNAENLMKRIQALEIAPNIGVSRVYNNALHRLRLGPFGARREAELFASRLRNQLNVPAIILNP